MHEKIGLVQTGGIGDIIIALPIADHFLAKGHEVYWPIAANLVPMFTAVKPEVHFLPIGEGPGHFYDDPVRELTRAGCQRRYLLYSYLSHQKITDARLAHSLKFDEYKYAITGVPFDRKWTLNIKRNPERERAIYQRLGITREYICVHTKGSNHAADVNIPDSWRARYQIIEVEPLTDSPFDWIYTLEHAARLVLVDSCFANLVDQLNIGVEKYFICRSPVSFTPVMKNGWRFN